MHRVLYDDGVSPFGLVENLDRLGISPETFHAIVLSHGHFDHVAGLHGLIKRIGGRKLPVLLHPDFWSRRRIASPDRFVDLPTPSRAGIEDAGFDLIEDRQPSVPLGGVLLVTGEVPRTTAFETRLPPGHQAWVDGQWRHDPLVHEDQALVAHVRGRGLVVITGCGCATASANIVRQGETAHRRPEVHLVTGGLHLRDGPVLADGAGADRGTPTARRARPLHQLAGPSRLCTTVRWRTSQLGRQLFELGLYRSERVMSAPGEP